MDRMAAINIFFMTPLLKEIEITKSLIIFPTSKTSAAYIDMKQVMIEDQQSVVRYNPVIETLKKAQIKGFLEEDGVEDDNELYADVEDLGEWIGNL